MNYKNQHKYKIPSFAVSSMADGKMSISSRLRSIFEDDKKKKGIIALSSVLIITIIASSFVVFGNQKVKQKNDSLTIYTLGRKPLGDGGYSLYDMYSVEDIVRDYKSKYPNITVNVVEIREENDEIDFNVLYDRITTELMAGKGPDVLIADQNMMACKDINKLVRSGVFAEMDEFIKADTETDFENFIPIIMESGNYKGRRYLMPLRFTFPVLMTGETALKNVNIDLKQCETDYIGLMQEINKYQLNAPQNSKTQLFSDNYQLMTLLGNMGITSYQNRIVDNPEQVKQLLDLYKPLYSIDTTRKYKEYVPDSKIIKDGELIFGCYDTDLIYTALSSYGGISVLQNYDTPVFIPLRKPQGGITAKITTFAGINANSSNQQNAYNFIKMLMSANGNTYMTQNGLPVSKAYSKALIMTADALGFEFYNENWDLYISPNQKKYLQPISSMLDEINDVYQISPFDDSLNKILVDYFTDKITYDECYNKIKESVSLYQTE